MSTQTRTRLAQLIEEFPSISRTRSYFMWRPTRDSKLRYPEMHVAVQRPDTDLMYIQLRGTGNRLYTSRPNSDLRGERQQFLFAYDERGKPLGNSMTSYSRRLNEFAKDIFRRVNPLKVTYLTLESVYTWHNPAPDESEELFAPGIVGVEVDIIVYPKPKNTSWEELVALAEKQKKEEENAWRFNPKVMPPLPGIHLALRKGLRLHAFLSGGGLRVVSLVDSHDNEKAYGEHPHVEEALNYLDEDFLAGHRPYDEVYGSKGKYTHYLTGSSIPTSNLDNLLCHGNRFDVWQYGNNIVFVIHGYKHVDMPKISKVIARILPGVPIPWYERGFIHSSVYSTHLFANGEPGYSSRTLNPKKDGIRSTMYKTIKIGHGKTFWQAMENAFRAAEKEVKE